MTSLALLAFAGCGDNQPTPTTGKPSATMEHTSGRPCSSPSAKYTRICKQAVTDCRYLLVSHFDVDRAVRAVRDEQPPEWRDAATEGCLLAYKR